MNKKYFIPGFGLTLLLAYSCKTHYPLADERFTLIEQPQSQERGKNLVQNICGPCHYNNSLGKFAGNYMAGFPKFLGKIYSANLTHSEMFGVTAKYTNAQLSFLLKTGTARDGRYISYMLRPNMAEDDVNDIIVYLRSKDAAIAAAETSVGHTHYSTIGRLAMNLSGKPKPFLESIKRPSKDDSIANGRYLVDNLGCFHCHSKSLTSLNYLQPDQSKGYMQGGMKFKSPGNGKIHASNLTPDKATGIGNYSLTDFSTAVKKGKTPDNRSLRPPMDKFTHLTDKQVHDIYAYLKSLPGVEHKVKH